MILVALISKDGNYSTIGLSPSHGLRWIIQVGCPETTYRRKTPYQLALLIGNIVSIVWFVLI